MERPKSSSFTIIFLFTIIAFHKTVEGEKILFFFGFSTYSHRIVAWPLATALAEEGHSVTFLQGVQNRNPHPKVIDFNPEGVTHKKPNFVDLRLQHGQRLIYWESHTLPTKGVQVCKEFLNSAKNVQWVNDNKFDLVVIDSVANECAYGLAWKWNAKTIVFGTTHVLDWFPDTFGFPDESATVSGLHFSEDLPLTFFSRVRSALSYIYFYFNKKYRGIVPLDELLREKLSLPEMPPVTDIQKNTSLVYINTHFSEELPRSLPPLVVPVGGMHVSGKVKPLPKEMEDFVKGSGENGFVYVSFGSEADLAKSPAYIREMFWNVMRNTKTRFLWKWNGERPHDMPDNIMTSKWMPQQDILGHPKCRGFITHGGLLSMQEAVYFGVPMIVFPIFSEQDYNAERLQRTGRGIRLHIESLTQAQLHNAVDRLLNDQSIKHEMSLASKRFKDRPQTPLESALWWFHYVQRQEDTSFLRPHAISLNWYQRRQLDVWILISVTFVAFVCITLKIFRAIYLCCVGSVIKSNAKKYSLNKKRN